MSNATLAMPRFLADAVIDDESIVAHADGSITFTLREDVPAYVFAPKAASTKTESLVESLRSGARKAQGIERDYDWKIVKAGEVTTRPTGKAITGRNGKQFTPEAMDKTRIFVAEADVVPADEKLANAMTSLMRERYAKAKAIATEKAKAKAAVPAASYEAVL